ncbi:NAD(P)H-dependent flavin oxidoreductase [Anatilimnocola floriformis]|uniref:NAD(P)H-dependent flavin oxidoreductase n=1 Tax=Anatilimnocola floriformis TaxID=2948575 RepID=UPI0020C2166A|nr:nitronate monooxygenase [Anatilimnocola floriformis]
MNIADLFQIEFPVIQAPMAGSQGVALAAAVSSAGGLSSFPAAMFTPDGLRGELAKLRQQTDKPFNANFFCHEPPTPDAERERAWRHVLLPFYREYGIDPEGTFTTASRAPFSAEMADVLDEFRPAVVSFHFGLPAPELLARVKKAGAKIISSATMVAEATWLEQHGVDAIIAQGAEAGGHRGMFLTSDITTQVGTFALVPQIVRAVKVPVIAAGGIADAAGVAAARELGAAGVQVGTAYLFCPEATTAPLHRTALQSETAGHTALMNVFTGRPARGIISRLPREIGPMNAAAPDFPLAAAALSPLRAAAEAQGKPDFSPLWAGQNARSCRVVSAYELTRELASGWNM